MSQYPHFLSPIKIGNLELKNRAVMAAMGTRLPTATGFSTKAVVDYYLARARGGTGLIIFQFTAVTAEGNASPRTTMLYDDRFIPGLREVTDAVHEAGSKIAVELAHGGAAGAFSTTYARPKSPSGFGHMWNDPPLPMTEAEIWTVIEAFGQAAGRARAAGFDSVQIHACHGYLIHQFLSPLRNRRDDAWGGDVERRSRFLLEITRRIRREVGADYPLMVRLVVDEGLESGINLEDSKITARLLAEAGIDCLDVTGGGQETFYLSTPPNMLPQGVLAPYGEAIKKAVDLPVVIVGRITTPELADQLIAEGKGDLIAFGRQMLADPDFVRKAEEGRADEIRQCLACTSPQCHGRIFKCLPVGCVVNPIVAREAQFPMKPAAQSKEVLVIGAGPAGMEAAITAAKRGHRVTLWEAAGEVGGQLVMGQVPPHKEMISRLLAYYRRQLELAGVRLELGKRASPEEIKRFGYDELIVATGGQPLQPPIPGAAEHAISAWEVLSGRAEVGANVAIIGGGDVGCELAEYIAGKGSQVTIVEMLDDVAPGFLIGAKPLLIREFRQLGLDYITKAKVTRIEAGSLTLDRGGVEYHMDGFDTIVLCVGTVSQNELSAALRRDGVDFYEVGDCVRPRTIYEAVTSGFEAGYSI